MYVCAQSCLMTCDPMNCSPPSSSVHGVFHAKILESVAIFYSRRSSRPRDLTHVSCTSCIDRQILCHYTIWEIIYYAKLYYISEKAMAPLFSTLAWKIPWMEEPGRLQSMGSLRVGHNWVTSLSLHFAYYIYMYMYRRKWQLTPVFLSKESCGQRSLVSCCP